MNKEFAEINKKYNDETYPVFPYVSMNRITPLKKGLYRKHKASFRGITAVHNKEFGVYEFPLYGMYNVEKDLVIVPPGINMTTSKQALLDALLKAGYEKIESLPTFKPLTFSPDSKEANLALANKAEFQSKLED